jgi:hypothetical protein
MPDKQGKKFLILLSVSPATPDRLSVLVPALKGFLERISTEPVEQLFRAVGADHFGYFIRSRLVAPQILAALEAPQKHPWERGFQPIEPFLTNQDSAAVIEIGTDVATHSAFSRARTWLERH